MLSSDGSPTAGTHPLREGAKTMSPDRFEEASWEFYRLTPQRWADFEELFGPRGATGGCWCMWWRLTARDFDAQKGEANRRSMQAIVGSGHVPGILAYHEGHLVGWCSVAPREEFPRLGRSRILKPVDDEPVWSMVCFFIAKSYRRKGVARRLLSPRSSAVRWLSPWVPVSAPSGVK